MVNTAEAKHTSSDAGLLFDRSKRILLFGNQKRSWHNLRCCH
jgi:hypothetical protein